MKLYTLEQAREMLKYADTSTIRHYIHEGRIEALKLGRDWFLTPAQFKKLKGIRDGRKK
jgi:hypothetical protein